jgi:hypothetical protein
MQSKIISGWNICLDKVNIAIAAQSCLVYSYSHGNSSSLGEFEEAMLTMGCQVFSFSPYVTSMIDRPNHRFKQLALTGGGGKGISFPQLVQSLGHVKNSITMLKIDNCGGCEWDILGSEHVRPEFFQQIQQLLIDMYFITRLSASPSPYLMSIGTSSGLGAGAGASTFKLVNSIGRTFDNLFSYQSDHRQSMQGNLPSYSAKRTSTSTTSNTGFLRFAFDYTNKSMQPDPNKYPSLNQYGFPEWACCGHAVFLMQETPH